MNRTLATRILTLSLMLATVHLFPEPAASQALSPESRSLISQYCVTCHNQRANTGGLALDAVDLSAPGAHAEVLERVVRKVRTGMMPPSGAPRPERSALDALASDLEMRLDEAGSLSPNPGSPALHRLNRTEYANAIRDLLALDIDVTTMLPADDASEGFDNIADVLGVSPSLIQGYVSAAMKISRFAVGDMTLPPSVETYTVSAGLQQGGHIEGLPLGTRGGLRVDHTFPLDAEYEFRAGRGGGDFTIDGVSVPLGRGATRIPVKAGPHTLAVAVVDRRRSTGVDGIYTGATVGGGVQSITINGPFDAAGPGDTPARRKIFVCYPATEVEETPCARRILSSLSRKAFRRPVEAGEVEELLRFYEQGRREGDFEIGIQQALARILVAPRFLYRFEDEPQGISPGETYRLTDLELASRLSFFLWSSIPDDELLELAIEGRLGDPGVLEEQVWRMLEDPRAHALVENFASQWLYLRELENVQPESTEFDENLRRAFIRETEMLFEEVLENDQSVLGLLDSDHTFIDARLARHYGIPDVRDSYFRRIELAEDSPRRGLLGHGSILTATSVANRTSPVTRGKWILENLLGAAAPEPPAGVETNLDPDPDAPEADSLRERLEMHRENPVCASCHKIMDPIGFVLENFDLVGAWRDFDGVTPIDPTGVLVDGTPLGSPADLRAALMSRSDAYVTRLTEKLLMYALGRGVEYYDMPAVRRIVRDAGASDYRFSSLVLGIVRSRPFQMKMKPSADFEGTDAAGTGEVE